MFRQTDDAFMQVAVEGKPYIQQYPIDSENPTVTKEIDASTLWKKIVHNAWKSAEPDVLFWDTIIRSSSSSIATQTLEIQDDGVRPIQCGGDSIVSL